MRRVAELRELLAGNVGLANSGLRREWGVQEFGIWLGGGRVESVFEAVVRINSVGGGDAGCEWRRWASDRMEKDVARWT